MPNSAAQPLMTLAIAAYNQERFIREAVAGAFAQTYAPLEIILSDDVSKDRTFAIMEEMAAAYRGPHRVVLNRNPKNAGLAAHTNRIFSLAQGELVVLNAGDDISLPHRVAAIVQAWEASGRKSFGVHSRVVDMDQDGRVHAEIPKSVRENCFEFENGLAAVQQFMREEKPVILGCTGAYARALFDRFGPLPADVVYEDMTVGFRARLMGGMAFVDDPLVLYRLHDANAHHADVNARATVQVLQEEERRRLIGLERRLSAAGSFNADIATAKRKRLLPEQQLAQVTAAVEGFSKSVQLELEFRRASWIGRLARYQELKQSCSVKTSATESFHHQLYPRWFYWAIRILKSRMRERQTHPGA